MHHFGDSFHSRNPCPTVTELVGSFFYFTLAANDDEAKPDAYPPPAQRLVAVATASVLEKQIPGEDFAYSLPWEYFYQSDWNKLPLLRTALLLQQLPPGGVILPTPCFHADTVRFLSSAQGSNKPPRNCLLASAYPEKLL